MTGEELADLLRDGAEAARSLERTLIDGYHVAIMAAARRASRLFAKRATILGATAGWYPPQKSEIIDEAGARQVQTRRTENRRAQIASAAIRPAALAAGADDQRVSEAVDAVLAALAPLSNSVAEAIAEPVEAAVRQGFEEGWSVPRTANLIVEKVGEMAGWKAEMLARTDLVAISNLSSLEGVKTVNDAAREQGQPTFGFKRWLSAGDDDVRETHAEADGQVVPIGEPFKVGGANLQYPGDPFGPPEETWNCRCTQIYVESEEEAVSETALAASSEPFYWETVEFAASLVAEPHSWYDEPHAWYSEGETVLSSSFVPLRADESGDQLTGLVSAFGAAMGSALGRTMPPIAAPPDLAPLIGVVGESLAAAANRPAPEVTVNVPEQPPPVVNVTTPETAVNVTVPEPKVTVQASKAPVVNVKVDAPPPRKIRFERDHFGQLSAALETDE